MQNYSHVEKHPTYMSSTIKKSLPLLNIILCVEMYFLLLCITSKDQTVNATLGVSFTFNLSLICWKKNPVSLEHVPKQK